MRLKLVFFLLACVAAGPAFANVSRIHHDNSFSGNLTREKKSDGIYLVNERLEITFPQLTLDYESLDKNATVVATYTISNRAIDAVELPLRFLGVDIANPAVTLNGSSVPTAMISNKKDEQEFLLKLAEHRYLWDKQRYSSFLNHFLPKSPEQGATLEDIRAAASSVKDISAVLEEKIKPGSLSFTASLQPGNNEVTVTYVQKLAFDGRTTYLHGPDGWTEFNYLIYPMATWELDKNFEMTVMVNIPDYLDKGWFSNTLYAPEHKSNSNFYKIYNSWLKTTRLGAKYKSIPGNILTILIRKGRKR